MEQVHKRNEKDAQKQHMKIVQSDEEISHFAKIEYKFSIYYIFTHKKFIQMIGNELIIKNIKNRNGMESESIPYC